MKKVIQNILFALLAVSLYACGKEGGQEEPTSDYNLNRADIIGEWDIKQAKFDKDATMTDWALETTTFNFQENGFFEAKGYFGNGTGSFSISGSRISTNINNQPFIDFVVNGINDKLVDVVATIQASKQKVWMTLYQPVVVIGGGGDVPPEFPSNERDVRMAISWAYSKLMPFVVNKQAIENDITSGQFEILSASGHEIMHAWEAAYESLYFINDIIDKLNVSSYKDAFSGYIVHLKALRGLIAYNLSTLWGKARFEKTPHEAPNQPPIFTAEELLQVASKDLEDAYNENYSLKDVDKQRYLNPDACTVLLGEVSLALGNKNLAQELFGRYINNSNSPELFFEFTEYDENGQFVQTIPVYTLQGVNLLYKEASGQLGGLVESWRQNNLKYGYWQMLKRNGWAESVTGCQTYQLLFPYPWNEVSDEFPQNPGY